MQITTIPQSSKFDEMFRRHDGRQNTGIPTRNAYKSVEKYGDTIFHRHNSNFESRRCRCGHLVKIHLTFCKCFVSFCNTYIDLKLVLSTWDNGWISVVRNANGEQNKIVVRSLIFLYDPLFLASYVLSYFLGIREASLSNCVH